MTVTLLDAILIGIMLVSGFLAMVRGFSREVLSVLSWLAAAVAAYMFYGPVMPYAQRYISNEMVAMGVSALIVFLVTLIIVSFITLRIADFIIDSRVGPLDRALGFIFGAVRGLLLVVVAILFFNWLAPAETQPAWVANAQSKPWLDDLGQRLVTALPENPERMILGRLDDDAEGSDEPTSIEGAIENGTPAEGTTE
ncbi:CvpA family protein [Consotaella aegiceratis]|uniref:CvpA family protein n=1 Tax=Consotaella aegiceratis TaxID=3097961 RepID=UPI002F414D64